MHRARPNNIMRILLVVDVLCVTQASVHGQGDVLAITEKVRSAKNALESRWRPAYGH